MCVVLLELDKFYCGWNIVNDGYVSPIDKKTSLLISQFIEESEIIIELNKDDDFKYKISFYKKVDLIIIYDINKLNDIPNYYKGRVIIHSLEKINYNILLRKGLEIASKFEYTTVRKYRNVGLFLYHLESEPWYLKYVDILYQDLDKVYEHFNLNKNIRIAKYSLTLVLEKKEL